MRPRAAIEYTRVGIPHSAFRLRPVRAHPFDSVHREGVFYDSLFRRSFFATAFLLAAFFTGGSVAFAHGNQVKITDDATHTTRGPQYREVTVNADGSVSFWGVTVHHGTITYSDQPLTNAYFHFQAIALDRANPLFAQNSSSFASVVAQAASAQSKFNVHYLGGATSLSGSYAFRDDDQSNVYVFPMGSKLVANGKSLTVGNQSFLVASGGGNLVASGGGNLTPQAVANVISNDGGSLIARNSSLIGQDGGGLLAGGATSVLPKNDAGIVSHDSGGIVSHDSGGLVLQGELGYGQR